MLRQFIQQKPSDYLLAPDLPNTEVLDPTLTTSLPVIVPEMITTLAVLPATAVLRASSVVTVTGDADPPPVVLNSKVLPVNSQTSPQVKLTLR